ncbi:MAG: methyltransferase [Gemmataceae bacterium]
MTDQAQADWERLFQMLNGYMICQPLFVVARLGIADLLAAGPRTPSELAESVKAHAPSLQRVLRTLASLGLFRERDDGRFELLPMGRLLSTDDENSLRGWAVLRGSPLFWTAWGEILHAVQTGTSAFDKAFGKPSFDYLAENPEEARLFDWAMRSLSQRKFDAVAQHYDFLAVERLVDVGGGDGGMMITILNAHPGLQGVIAELPHVVPRAKEQVAAANLTERCQCVPVNMFESVPEGDCYVMGNVIHDWNDERAGVILENCRKAMPKHGRVLLVEFMSTAGNESCLAKLWDMEMLVMTTEGRERTETEFANLFASAGLRLHRVHETSTPWSIVEGRAK